MPHRENNRSALFKEILGDLQRPRARRGKAIVHLFPHKEVVDTCLERLDAYCRGANAGVPAPEVYRGIAQQILEEYLRSQEELVRGWTVEIRSLLMELMGPLPSGAGQPWKKMVMDCQKRYSEAWRQIEEFSQPAFRRDIVRGVLTDAGIPELRALEDWEQELRRIYGPRVGRTGQVNEVLDLNDLVQEGLQRYLRYWRTRPREFTDFPYRRRIAMSALVVAIRKTRRKDTAHAIPAEIADPREGPAEQAERKDQIESKLKQCVRWLRSHNRKRLSEIFEAFIAHNGDAGKAAESLGMSVQRFHEYRSRAVAYLRKNFPGFGKEQIGVLLALYSAAKLGHAAGRPAVVGGSGHEATAASLMHSTDWLANAVGNGAGIFGHATSLGGVSGLPGMLKVAIGLLTVGMLARTAVVSTPNREPRFALAHAQMLQGIPIAEAGRCTGPQAHYPSTPALHAELPDHQASVYKTIQRADKRKEIRHFRGGMCR